MKFVNISELALLAGTNRATVIRKVSQLEAKDGTNGQRLYNSKDALRCIFVGDAISPQDRLADKRTEEIDLNMEVTRRERIPLEDVEDHNEQVLQNVAGIFKASEGKKLTPELVQELFAELRRLDEVLGDYCRKRNVVAPVGKPRDVEDTLDDPFFQ